MSPTEAKLLAVVSDGQWHSKAALRAAGITRDMIRSTAIYNDGRLLGHQHGYRLTASATREEIDHNINRLRSMAHNIEGRADAIATFARN
jgi:hypothetical protein